MYLRHVGTLKFMVSPSAFVTFRGIKMRTSRKIVENSGGKRANARKWSDFP